MILITDVHYLESSAYAAGIIIETWEADRIVHAVRKHIDTPAPYESGAFYKRELPCLLALLEDLPQTFTCIVVDGYAKLSGSDRPGLGLYLYKALDMRVPIIGVAKRSFYQTPTICEVFRGNSAKPLYVTSAGISLTLAKECILKMHGTYRIPLMLKRVDQLARTGNSL